MKKLLFVLLAMFFLSCAGFERGCSQEIAQGFGADWVIVELKEATGTPYRCWMLTNVSVANEMNSDGIYWKAPEGHLIHISGSYDYVQVKGGQWDSALAQLNLTQEACRAVGAARYDWQEDRYE